MTTGSSTEPPPREAHLMVSYARLDGRALAAKLRAEIKAVLGVAPWQDVLDMDGGEAWWRQIEEQIQRSVGLVLALTPGALTSDVVRREWVCARRNGKPVYPVVEDQRTLGPEAPRWLRMVDVFVLDETHPDVAQARRRFHEQLREPPDVRPVPFMPGALPPHHVSRLAERASLLNAFVAPSDGNPIFSDVVLQGAPGFGKTTLARELCHEPSVVNAFSGGILWATLGEHGQVSSQGCAPWSRRSRGGRAASRLPTREPRSSRICWPTGIV
jgi:hypothetical protein